MGAMHEPAAFPRLSVVALAAAGFVLSACQDEPGKSASPPVAATVEPMAPPAPISPPMLGRVELLRDMEDSAAAYAAGQPAEGGGLAGRRFTLRQAFGCHGPATAPDKPADGLARWSWKDERKAIELSLTPGDWTDSALVTGAAPDWEAVEGIWLVRPWQRAEGCPGVQADPLASGPPAPSPQTMGLAAVFETGGSRIGQRNGRAYSFTVHGKNGQPPLAPADGYRLVVEGRLASFADGRAVHCHAANPEQRPVCVAAARLDRVAFEDASGAVLSEWRPG